VRIYNDFCEALGEIRRDVKEMGVSVHTKSMQNKDISNDPSFATLEVSNYIYTVTWPDARDLHPTLPWADLEFNERMSGTPINPGSAWKERSDIWEEFLVPDLIDGSPRFDYTYSERFHSESIVHGLIASLRGDPLSRQHFVSIWRPTDIHSGLGNERIPCSLGYWLQYRNEKLHITYLQRSADLATHFENDIYLAHRFMRDIAERMSFDPGSFTHWIGSLHVYQKDVEGVF